MSKLDFITYDFLKLERTINTLKESVSILKTVYDIDSETICFYVMEVKCPNEKN